MTRLISAVLVLASVAAPAQQSQTFTGVITDSECATANHRAMGMGATDAECAAACVYSHGASYVLFDGKTTLALSDQKAPAQLAGRKVVVTGTLDAKANRITVQSIKAAS
jgi:hypothetical protein